MPSEPRPQDPLAEIEALQDEVLRKLDELNARLERTLAEYGTARSPEEPLAEPLPDRAAA